ncbi:MAG: EAL domain-containing protein [Acidobacteriota bacterium]
MNANGTPSKLDAILQPGGISVVFQPIFRFTPVGGCVQGLECLSRGPKGSSFERADILFDYVRRKKEEPLVDRACITEALNAAAGLVTWQHLFLNLHAVTLERHSDFAYFLVELSRKFNISLSRVTLEITEQGTIRDYSKFLQTLNALRESGVSLALDDVGSGYSNFKMILDCRPDYIKADKHLIKNCSTDRHRRVILESLAYIAREFHSEVIAEGIENLADMERVLGLGINMLQGFLLSPPMRGAELIASDLLHQEFISDFNHPFPKLGSYLKKLHTYLRIRKAENGKSYRWISTLLK